MMKLGLRNRRLWTCCLLAFLGIALLSLGAITSSALTVDLLYDLLSDDLISTSPLNTHRIDPTGQRIAWLEQGNRMMLFEISPEAIMLTDIPFPDLMRPATAFQWSPDGQRVAMTESALLHRYEPDIWTIDLSDISVRNCTNDLAFGHISDGSNDTWVDLFPTWRTADTLAFVRSTGNAPGEAAELRTIAVDACGAVAERADPDASKLLWPFPAGFPDAFEIFAPPVWAPNGERLAIITQSQVPGLVTDGIWILNAETGATLQFVPTERFASAFPAWYGATYLVPQDLAWLGDGEHLLVFVEDIGLTAGWPRMNLFIVDSQTGSAQAIADYSSYTTRLQFYEQDDNGHTGLFDVPLQALVLPGGSAFITLHQEIEAGNDDLAAVELRLFEFVNGAPMLRHVGTLDATVQPRSRGDSMVHIAETGKALLLNRYIVQFDLELIGSSATAD